MSTNLDINDTAAEAAGGSGAGKSTLRTRSRRAFMRIFEITGTDYRQWIGGSAVLSVLIAVAINARQGDLVVASILLVATTMASIGLVWWTRPHRGGFHQSHAAAQAAAGPDDVIVYWRPGCIFCDRLKLGLGDASAHVTWVNIALDPDAARFVAAANDGDEVVPMVVTGAGQSVRANAAAITAQLAQRARLTASRSEPKTASAQVQPTSTIPNGRTA
jgi:glutaredoxin